MKKRYVWTYACLWATWAAAAMTYNDSTGDVAIFYDQYATLDIVQVEVSHTSTELVFDLTVNGDFSDEEFGRFMIGIATGGAGTTSGNGWGRPIHLDSPIGGMNYWIGSGVDGGGGAHLFSYNGSTWAGPSDLAAFSFAPGAQSLLTLTVALTNLGLEIGDTFYFDVYTSGTSDEESAADALSNPDRILSSYDEIYTSDIATGISSYAIVDATADVVPGNGPFAGGNAVLVTNAVPAIGNGGDITNVLVGGVAAAGLLGQGTNWVRFTAPATGSAGAKAVAIQSTSVGNVTLPRAYAVNPAGQIWGREIMPGGPYMAGGGFHALGLKSDGTVVGWGLDEELEGEDSFDEGQTTVPPPNADFRAVAAGDQHSLGLKSDGTMVGWGRDDYGQTEVPEPNADFIKVAAGRQHSMGLKSDGTIVAWGGAINIGAAAVPSPNADFVAIAAGEYHSLGLKSNGTIVAWGGNDFGQCAVPEPNTDFVAVAAGVWHSLGLKADGSVVGWGLNDSTQAEAPSPNAGFVAIAAGRHHSLGLKSDGTVVVWGDSESMVVPEPNADFVAIAAGSYHSMGLKSDGTIVTWGYDPEGLFRVPEPNENFGLWAVGVEPAIGSWTGGYEVVIRGENLGDGADVTNVALCGVAASIVSQSATQIVVAAGFAASAGAGDVRVYSTSYGETVKSNAFEYLREEQAPLVFAPASPQAYGATHALSVSGGSGTGAVSFAVLSGPGTIADDTNLTVTAGSGSIEIRATKASDDLYAEASVTGTVAAIKATATVELASLAQTYDGTPKAATATTGPEGLTVAFTYAGNAWAPTNAGSYAVTGTVNEANWQGTATGTLVISRGQDTIVFGATSQVYDGTGKAVTATADSGSPVAVTYNGSPDLPVNAGTYAVTGIVNAANWAATNSAMLVISRGQDTIVFGATSQVYDGTGKAVTATADSGSPVAVTYNGSPDLPVNVGTYAVTGIVNAANWAATNSATLAITKADQAITNFLPPDGSVFVLGTATSLSAQASSGLGVGFTNLTPETAHLTGTDIAFTNPGVARVQAFQAGDLNWNAAVPIVHEWRVGGQITNVAPAAANVGGGIEVRIQGLWLGDGTSITTVELAGVAATILSQSPHEVMVRAGMAPATATGDVVVVSGTGGTMVLSNAFEYLWLEPPEQLDPVDITPTNLVARWVAVSNAETHYLDVSTSTNFPAYLPGYNKLDVAMAQQYPVEGLADGTWYALRLYAWTTNGLSWPSRTVWVPAMGNTPYETHPPLAGPVSQGAVMDHSLSNMFHGAGLVYAAESSDTDVMTVSVEPGGRLVMNPVGPGTVVITVTATDPATGYTCAYSFTVQVVGAPALDSDAFLPREPWNPRFTQALVVRNDSGMDAIGVRVLFTNLMPGITVENRTGTAVDGRPMIEMQTAFPDGAALPLNLVYLCTGAFRADQYPPTIELQYILPEWTPPLPGEGAWIGDGFPLSGGRYGIQFGTVPGRLYAVEYRNNFPGGVWVEVPLRLRATANQTQWIDAGPPATQPPEGLRVYRVKEVAE